jgi:hypothetical protein
MPRNGETSSSDDQVRAKDVRASTSDPAEAADLAAAGQPGVTAAAVTAGLAGRPLTAVPDEDAAGAPEQGHGPADDPVGAGSRGVPPAEGQWVAGTRHPAAVPTPPDPPGPAATADRATPEPAATTGAAATAGAGAPLLTGQAGLRERWMRIQAGFIDDPRASVTEAAGFVGEISTTIVTAVQERERSLRGTWDTGTDAGTEDLRNALREYRTFFELLAKL